MSVHVRNKVIDNNISTRVKHKNRIDKNVEPRYPTFEQLTNGQKITVEYLKILCKQFNLKRTGKKSILLERIKEHLHRERCIVRIQSVFRGHLIRKFMRMICHYKCYINQDDFLSLENFRDIPFYERVHITENNFIYGFHIYSLSKLLEKEHPQNPYTRIPIERSTYEMVDTFIRLSKINGFVKPETVEIQNAVISKKVKLERRVVSIFIDIDRLGHTTNIDWFHSMSRNRCIYFLRDLYDIWNYRASLSMQTKCNICPPNGNPFFDINRHTMMDKSHMRIQHMILNVIDRLVNRGINQDSKFMGSSYVLCAFTLHVPEAAQQMPWYYESVRH